MKWKCAIPILGAAVLLLVSSCVPATGETDPRGAAGFTVSPSAVTLGTPFETRDGYTIRVERFVANLNANWVVGDSVSSVSGSGSRVLFVATGPLDVFGRAISEGDAAISLAFGRGKPDRADHVPGVSSLEVARFDEEAGSTGDAGASRNARLPSILVVARVEGKGRKYLVDATVVEAANVVLQNKRRDVVVRRDALTLIPAGLHVEALFSVGGASFSSAMGAGVTPEAAFGSFQSFADADTDGDGVLTSRELGAARPSEEERADAEVHLEGPVYTLGDLLVARTRRLLAY